jgi:hypothetical protein
VLNGDARPMVHGVGQSVMACLSSDDDAALARALGDRRDSRQAAQGGVVTPLQGIEHFCEQRGEYDPSHSRQGFKDLESCWLRCPRLGFRGGNETGVEGFGRSGGDFERRLAQIEKLGDRRLTDARGLVRRRRDLQRLSNDSAPRSLSSSKSAGK